MSLFLVIESVGIRQSPSVYLHVHRSPVTAKFGGGRTPHTRRQPHTSKYKGGDSAFIHTRRQVQGQGGNAWLTYVILTGPSRATRGSTREDDALGVWAGPCPDMAPVALRKIGPYGSQNLQKFCKKSVVIKTVLRDKLLRLNRARHWQLWTFWSFWLVTEGAETHHTFWSFWAIDRQ